MILGVGTDIVEIDRIAALMDAGGSGFADRWFTAAEQAYCAARSRPAAHFAARFAAKEAVAKALRWRWTGPVPWREVEIGHDETGAPVIFLHGGLAALADAAGAAELQVSLAHGRDHATAVAVAVAASDTPRRDVSGRPTS